MKKPSGRNGYPLSSHLSVKLPLVLHLAPVLLVPIFLLKRVLFHEKKCFLDGPGSLSLTKKTPRNQVFWSISPLPIAGFGWSWYPVLTDPWADTPFLNHSHDIDIRAGQLLTNLFFSSERPIIYLKIHFSGSSFLKTLAEKDRRTTIMTRRISTWIFHRFPQSSAFQNRKPIDLQHLLELCVR